MIKGVIFDIDGVVLDSMSIWKDLGARYLISRGIEPEEGLNEILFSMSMEQGAEYAKEHYGLNESVEEILDGIRLMIQSFYFDEVQAKSGAESLMSFMKENGIKITAATSSPRIHIERALERNGLLGFFEKIFTTSEIGVSKHSPVIYNKAVEFMCLDVGRVLVLEDSLYALKTASAAGYRTVGVYDKDGETDQDGVRETGDLYIWDLNELVDRWDEL